MALAFESPVDARDVLATAAQLAETGRLTLHDAVLVWRYADGTIETEKAAHTAPVATAVPSTLVGALVGTLIAGPIGLLIGGVLGGGGGALVAKLVETDIPRRVVTQLQALTRPGQTVLALLVSDVTKAAAAELHQGSPVIDAEIPAPALARLRRPRTWRASSLK